MPRLVHVLLTLVALVAVALFPAATHGATRLPAISPQVFDLRAGDIPGWHLAKVYVSRRESNWRAGHDSQSSRLYFYRGSWSSLHRATGWYEHMLLYHGSVDVASTILVSEFSNAHAASRAYAAITASLPLKPLAIGTRTGEWQPLVAIASGPGDGGASRTFVVYLQDGPVVAEISSAETAPGHGSLADAGRAIARKLATVIHDALQPMASSTTTVDGLRLTLSLPDRVYPRDALAEVTMEVTNLTGSRIEFWGDLGGTLADALQINELDDAGQVVPEPSAFADYALPPPPGPPIPFALPPHETLTLRRTVIVWADHIRVRAQCFTGCGDILGTPVAVRLGAADTPSIDLLDSGAGPAALVRVAAGWRGRLLYRTSIECRLVHGEPDPSITHEISVEIPGYAELQNAWEQTHSILFTPPPCPQDFGPATLSAWKLIVGWPNHSAGALDYRVPGQEQSESNARALSPPLAGPVLAGILKGVGVIV